MESNLRDGRTPTRTCHFCTGPIPNDEKAIQAETKNAWMHFECWYDGAPFDRDPYTGRELRTKANNVKTPSESPVNGF